MQLSYHCDIVEMTHKSYHLWMKSSSLYMYIGPICLVYSDTPAANILLFVEILFNGSTPGKMFHCFDCLHVANISDRSFHLQQSQYLQPPVLSEWNHHQYQLLLDIPKKDSSLVIGGDRRADSPDHSAKFVSYGVIDLDTNKVLHIELVQVYNINQVFCFILKYSHAEQ